MVANGVLQTARGSISVVNGLVSLTDIWDRSGHKKVGCDPISWCLNQRATYHGDETRVLADQNVAMAYAWHLSPSLAGTLKTQLDEVDKVERGCLVKELVDSSSKSRDVFVRSLKTAGIKRPEDFAKLSDLLYQHTLGVSTRTLRNAYGSDDKYSIRHGLDTRSLAMVMSCEIHVATEIHVDSIRGYSEVADVIRKLGQMTSAMYRTKSH